MWTCCILKAAKCDLQSSGGTVDRTRHCSSRGPMKAGGCKLVTVTAGFGSKAASVRSWAISDAELVPETACIPRVWSLQGCLGPHGYNKPCSCKVIEWAQRVNVHAVKNRHMRCRIYRWQLSQMQLDTKMPHIDTPLKMRVRDPHLAGFAHKIKVAVLWDSLSLSLSLWTYHIPNPLETSSKVFSQNMSTHGNTPTQGHYLSKQHDKHSKSFQRNIWKHCPVFQKVPTAPPPCAKGTALHKVHKYTGKLHQERAALCLLAIWAHVLAILLPTKIWPLLSAAPSKPSPVLNHTPVLPLGPWNILL